MKKTLAVSTVVCGLLAAYCGSTWWAARHTQTLYEQQVAVLQQHYPGLKVIEHRYDRGFLHADAYTTLQFGADDPDSELNSIDLDAVGELVEKYNAQAGELTVVTDRAATSEADADSEAAPDEDEEEEDEEEAETSAAPLSIRLQLHDHITHGPITGLLTFGAARIASTLTLDAGSRADIAQALNGQVISTADTQIGFNGSFKSSLQGPTLDWKTAQGEHLVWQGYSGTLSQAAGTQLINYELNAPGLQIDNSSAGTHVGFSSLSLRGIDKSINALWALSGRDEGQIGQIQIVFDETVDDGKPFNLTLDNVQFHQSNKLTGDLLDSQIRINGTGQAGEVPIKGFEMQTSFTRLHTPSYLHLTEQLAALDPADAESQAQAVRDSLAAMLAYNPVYALDKLALDIDGQRGEVSYQLSMPGVTPEEKDVPLSLLAVSRLNLQAQANLPVSWMEWMARESALDDGAELTPAGSQALLEELVQQGLVVREGTDRIKTSLSYQHGELEINGKLLRSFMDLLDHL